MYRWNGIDGMVWPVNKTKIIRVQGRNSKYDVHALVMHDVAQDYASIATLHDPLVIVQTHEDLEEKNVTFAMRCRSHDLFYDSSAADVQ